MPHTRITAVCLLHAAWGLALAPAIAEQPASPDPLQAMNAQQLFDAASNASVGGHCKEALPMFDALMQRGAVTGNPRVLATARLRRAPCLVSAGRYDEASADVGNALAAVPANDALLRVDIAQAHEALGRAAYYSLAYDDAAREFELALSLLRGSEQLEALKWLVQSTMFEPGQRAVDYADRFVAVAKDIPDQSKTFTASVATLHARALLNHGQAVAAYAELKKALAEQGGLGTRVGVGDVETRADLALAALLSGDKDSARRYLAYTGAGHFDKAPFASAQWMNPPPCGGAAELGPDDMAVIEFSINDAGEVASVMPVYASRNGPIAAEFARAVAGWTWRPEKVHDIPAFFRMMTRVELRCLTTTVHPNVLDVLHGDLVAFLDARHVEPFDGDVHHAAGIAAARAEADRLVAGGQPLAAVPASVALGGSPLLDSAEQLHWQTRARDVLAAQGAPLAALTYLDIGIWSRQNHGWNSDRRRLAYLRGLLAQPEIASDAHVADTLRLLLADARHGAAPAGEARDMVASVATDPALKDQDPLRVGALLRLATLQSDAGDLAAARDSYQKTGLAAQQCALVDAVPVVQRFGNAEFPDEAKRWGFEGWVMLEFDIQPDGKTVNQRAVVAYPPLIFADAALETAKDMRYSQTFRPEGGLGCGGKHIKVSFDLNRR